MPEGIVVFGANGSGKSTLGRALAHALDYHHMDIEDYCFLKSEIPYTAPRPREECLALMRADVQRYGSFVLSDVAGDFGVELTSLYRLAVLLSAPLEVRLRRIWRRAYEQYGERVLEGGDMHRQQREFMDFVAARPLAGIEEWAETLSCPVLRADGTRPISENVDRILERYAAG